MIFECLFSFSFNVTHQFNNLKDLKIVVSKFYLAHWEQCVFIVKFYVCFGY